VPALALGIRKPSNKSRCNSKVSCQLPLSVSRQLSLIEESRLKIGLLNKLADDYTFLMAGINLSYQPFSEETPNESYL
jgi:hypothetical protein